MFPWDYDSLEKHNQTTTKTNRITFEFDIVDRGRPC